jgi:hypothetical protein
MRHFIHPCDCKTYSYRDVDHSCGAYKSSTYVCLIWPSDCNIFKVRNNSLREEGLRISGCEQTKACNSRYTDGNVA